MKKIIPLFTFTFALHLSLMAETNSNSVLVKAWTREDVHFDTETGEFSSTNIPSAAESEAMYNAVASTVKKIKTYDGVERFEANVQPHVHFICGCCGAVLDLPQMETPESLRDRVASLTGGRVDSCQLSFTGTCHSCLEKNATA